MLLIEGNWAVFIFCSLIYLFVLVFFISFIFGNMDSFRADFSGKVLFFSQ